MSATRVRSPSLPAIEVVAVTRESTAAAVIRHAIASSVQRLVSNDPVVRAGQDPEGVHQARVATRRLRSDLRTFRPLLQRDWAEGLRQELHELADLLGTVRDTDVLSQRLLAAVDTLPLGDRAGATSAVRALERARDEARTELLEALRSSRYEALLEDLADAAGAPHLDDEANEPGAEVLPQLAIKAWRRLKRAVALLPPQPADERLHEIRILAKRCRYATEAVAPVTRPQVTVFAEKVAVLQDVLGRQHDAVVAEMWLREQAAAGHGDPLVLGQLVARERTVAARERDAWGAVWKKVRHHHPSAWV